MRLSFIASSVLVTGIAVVGMASRTIASNPRLDFGTFVADQLSAHSESLFGFTHPLEQSALGPYDGADNLQAIQVADGLHVSLVSSSVASAADQIAMWPDDDNPTVSVRLRRRDVQSRRSARGSVQARRQQRDDDRHRSRPPATRCDGHPGAPSSSLRKPSAAPPSRRAASTRLIDPVHITTVINVDRPRHWRRQRSAAPRQAPGRRQPLVRELRDQGGRHDDLRGRAGARAPSPRAAPVAAIYKFVPSESVSGQRPRSRPSRSRRSWRAPSSGCASRRRARRTGVRAPKRATARGSP